MPFCKVGTHYDPIAPSTLTAYERKSKDVSDEMIERWFNEALLPLQNDPYVHIQTDNRDYNMLFTGFHDNGLAIMVLSTGSDPALREINLTKKREMFELSREGQLFYFDPSLGEDGAMRQLFTRSVEADGQQDFELCVTGEVNEFPRKVTTEPKAPSWWSYVKAFFGVKSAKAEIQAYDDTLADYNKCKEMESTFRSRRSDNRLWVRYRTDGTLSTTFKGVKEAQAEKIRAYEESLQQEQSKPWKYQAPDTRKMSNEEFFNHVQSAHKRGEELSVSGVLTSENCTPENYYEVVTQRLESKVAGEILQKASAATTVEERNNILDAYKKNYTAIVVGLGEYVVSQTNNGVLTEHCSHPQEQSAAYTALTASSDALFLNGVNGYLEQMNRENTANEQASQQEKLNNEVRLENEAPKKQQENNPLAKG